MSAESVLLHVFYSTLPSVNYIFKNGKPAIFIDKVFRTAIESEIAELTQEVADGHPHIYIKEDEKTVQSDMLDPMNVLRERFFKEFQAQQAAAVNPENDMGTSTQEALKPASTQAIAQAAAGGSGSALTARLTNLANKG